MAVFMTKKEWSVEKYLTVVYGPAVAAVLLKDYEFQLFMYGMRVRRKGCTQDAYVNTMVSTEKVLSGKCSKDNLGLVKSRVDAGIDHADTLFNGGVTFSFKPSEPEQQEEPVHPEPPEPVSLGELLKSKLTEPPPVLGKVKLAEAVAVGQPVLGTSGGSVYYVIALSPKVKVAARLKSDSTLSIRVEGSPSADVQGRMTQMGMDSSGTHWSTHFKLNALPLERVIGAVLMGLGEKWSERVDSISELKKALHA